MTVKPKISDLQQLGNNIRRIRTEKSISRAQLAYEIGTSEKHLSRIELGEVNSGILTFIKIARILGTTLADLTYKVKF
ncbi:MAG: helix-turn-helix domain-containing protein [Bacteroidia bacterium]